MERFKLLLNLPYELTEADRTALTAVCPNAHIQAAPAELLERPDHIDGREADVLVTEFVPRELGAWPKLKFVQLVSAGINHLENHPIWQRDIPVATASGIHSVPMAQFATAAVLSLTHRMLSISEFTNTWKWPSRDALSGSVVRGRTAGILGYGSIGRECARQLRALGMRIVCMSRGARRANDNRFLGWAGTGDPEGKIPEQWFVPRQLSEMLPLCDVLLVTSPRTDETCELIGAQQLALLRPNTLVIIISRGGIVEENALAQALRSGKIAGAWVDGFAQEPPPVQHPLFGAPNAILTPHMSGVFDEYWVIFMRLLRENLRRFTHGEPLLNIADGQRGY
jgi:phosphoglycerate dehydrogenase-like enzyme